MIKRIKQNIDFLKAAKLRGWFSQWQENGDVISPINRARIQRETARHYIESLMKLLDSKDGGKK